MFSGSRENDHFIKNNNEFLKRSLRIFILTALVF